jgi:signal transduction histidine kinase/CheY-like chemotaxis protein
MQSQVTDKDFLLEQGRRIRALHEVISCPDLSFDQQIDETLRLGCQFLGTEIGKVGRQDPDNNISEFLNTVVLSDLPVKRGTQIPLDKTFCQITFSSPATIAISHVSESEYCDHPAARFLGMQSYIGCSINVHGEKFGTVNFSNRNPVSKPFTEADKDLVNLIGSWISVMMERKLDAEELRSSKEAAISANQAKSSFLANMSHEIRTPLTSIIGFAEAALDEDQSIEERVSALKTIKQSGDHLLNLINDILDFSKIEAGELDIENSLISPFEIVNDVCCIFSPQAEKKNLKFVVEYSFPIPEKINSDALRIKQILINLCSNAVKFTSTGEIRIKLQYYSSQDVLHFIVSDTGIGVSQEQLKELFKPFRQGDAGITRRFGGTGLGLSLSRRIAELLNGNIDVVSKSDEGSIFTLSLPYISARGTAGKLVYAGNQIPTTQQNQPSTLPGSSLSGEILLAEDNLLNQQLVQKYLEKTGATVTVAENGAVAVELARQHHFDLIFLDMQMPVMSGVDALKVLRESGYQLPIVMLTANVTQEDRNLCNEAGSNDFLTKPINRQKLYQVVEKYLQ